MTPKYAMSYLLNTGPEKPEESLDKNEGLTDKLIVHSVVGAIGSGSLNVATTQVGPAGPEELSPALAYHCAAVLLTRIQNSSGFGLNSGQRQAVNTAMKTLRDAIQGGL